MFGHSNFEWMNDLTASPTQKIYLVSSIELFLCATLLHITNHGGVAVAPHHSSCSTSSPLTTILTTTCWLTAGHCALFMHDCVKWNRYRHHHHHHRHPPPVRLASSGSCKLSVCNCLRTTTIKTIHLLSLNAEMMLICLCCVYHFIIAMKVHRALCWWLCYGVKVTRAPSSLTIFSSSTATAYRLRIASRRVTGDHQSEMLLRISRRNYWTTITELLYLECR